MEDASLVKERDLHKETNPEQSTRWTFPYRRGSQIWLVIGIIWGVFENKS